MNYAAKSALLIALFPLLNLVAQAPPTESVRPPASRKMSLAVAGLMQWQVGLPSTAFKGATFLDAAVKTDAAGLGAIEAFNSQQAGPQIQGKLIRMFFGRGLVLRDLDQYA